MSTASAGFVVGVVGSPDPETSPPKSRFRKPIAGDSATPDDIAALGGISSPGTEVGTLPQGHGTRRAEGPGLSPRTLCCSLAWKATSLRLEAEVDRRGLACCRDRDGQAI